MTFGLCCYIHFLSFMCTVNIPMMSFGLATGWVSGETGQLDESGKLVGIEQELPWAAAGTLVVALIATPLSQRLLNSGRKTALLATSAAYVVSNLNTLFDHDLMIYLHLFIY